MPGWDCHGLPIELQVEKQHGKEIPAARFRELCREYAASQVERQKADFIRLGVLGEWDNPYRTMDFRFEADIMRTLGRIHANGYLYQGQKPVHWCVDCGSALAEAEVEYEDKTSPAIDVAFAVKDVAALASAMGMKAPSQPVYAVIWTTTPWTLPANQAVSVHPEFIYDLIQTPKGILILAHDLAEACILRYGFEAVEVIAKVKGAALEHVQLQHPFYERIVPIICGEHVTLDAGTGLVHTAPAHGQDDYVIGSKYKLAVDCPVGDDGKFFERTPLVGGQSIWAANKTVLEILSTNGLLLKDEKLLHSYPHCWRHKTPIIFRATHQWFIGMEASGEHASLREAALKAVENTAFFPSWGRARLEAMIRNRPDWCVSRQRNWGVPMPLFVHKESGELHPRTQELLEQVAQRVEQQGIEAWFSLDAAELLGGDAASYKKVSDTLDVWFDSGSSHACVLKERDTLAHPADLYLEGSDQHRGWFQSSLAHRLHDGWPRPLQGAADPRLRGRCQGPQDEQIQGQRGRPAEGDGHAGRRHPAPVGGLHRLFRRADHFRRDPEARDRRLPPHPQHPALPARQPGRFRPGTASVAGRTMAGDRPLCAGAGSPFSG